jgi:hypothetical protein
MMQISSFKTRSAVNVAVAFIVCGLFKLISTGDLSMYFPILF